MYIPKFFRIQEYVPPEIYEDRGELAWELMDERILISDDQMRKRYGPITINNWHTGGRFSQSGIRTFWHYGTFADEDNPTQKELLDAHLAYFRSYSQHKYGRASDKKFRDVTPEEIRQDMIANPDLFPLVYSFELGTETWLHTDVRNCERIKTYTP